MSEFKVVRQSTTTYADLEKKVIAAQVNRDPDYEASFYDKSLCEGLMYKYQSACARSDIWNVDPEEIAESGEALALALIAGECAEKRRDFSEKCIFGGVGDEGHEGAITKMEKKRDDLLARSRLLKLVEEKNGV